MAPFDEPSEYIRTAIGHASADEIRLYGRDLATDVMGRMTLTELSFLVSTGREPNKRETRVYDAVLVSLADHGLTPTALAARLTLTGAPESVPAALAAGILGAGSVFLGPAEDTVRFLAECLDENGTRQGDVDTLARSAVRRHLASGARIPGLGHPTHRVEDPRTPRLFELADSVGLGGAHTALLRAVAEAYAAERGRRLPINGAGAAGAVLADMGFPLAAIRGSVLLARVSGLVGHILEEQHRPIGMDLWKEIDRRAVYQDASADTGPEEGR